MNGFDSAMYPSRAKDDLDKGVMNQVYIERLL